MRRRGLVNSRRQYPRLDERREIARVDLQNPIHLHGDEHDTILHGDCTAAEIGAAAARDDLEPLRVGELQDIGNLLRRFDKDNRFGRLREHRGRVVAVGDAFLG